MRRVMIFLFTSDAASYIDHIEITTGCENMPVTRTRSKAEHKLTARQTTLDRPSQEVSISSPGNPVQPTDSLARSFSQKQFHRQ